MASPVAMPKLGMTMEEGTLVSWAVPLGERVEKGQLLLVIESEKTEAEIEATASGFVRHVYVLEGEIVPCGTLLAALADSPDEPFDDEAFRSEHDRPEPVVKSTPAVPPPALRSEPRRTGRTPIAPAARRRARDLGIDPERVPGTGPGGRVTRQDVDAFAQARKSLVEVGGGVHLDVPTQGGGEPVVLLPGFGVDASAFARQIPTLAEHLHVLGVNPRGVGLSDAPEADVHAVAQSAADVAALLEGPTHVVGASLGAAVAIELALSQPDRVKSLTLVTPFVEATPRLLAVTDAWIRIAAEGTPDLLARALLPWFFSPGFLAQDAVRERTARGLAATLARTPASILERVARGLREWSGSRTADLAKIAAPTLVVVAGGDLLTPDAEAVAKAIPGARCVTAPEAGHGVALEAGDLVTSAILEHIQS